MLKWLCMIPFMSLGWAFLMPAGEETAGLSSLRQFTSLFGPLSASLGKRISERASKLTSGLTQQLQTETSPLFTVSRELREIFATPPPETSTTPLIDESFADSEEDFMKIPDHYIRAVDPQNPFNFAQLAKENERFEVIRLNDTLVAPGSRLAHLMSLGFNVFSKSLQAQQHIADYRPAWKRRLAADPAPRRRLQELLGGLLSGSRPLLGLLGSVLGAPPTSHATPPPVDFIAGPLPGDIGRDETLIPSGRRHLHQDSQTNDDQVLDRLRAKYGSNVIVEQADYCFMPGAEIIGANFLVVRAHDIYVCQKICAKNARCKYVTLRQDEELCYEYSNATSLKAARNTISGPKYCPGEEPKTHSSSPVNLDPESVRRQMEANARLPVSEATDPVLEGQQAGALAAAAVPASSSGLISSLGSGLGSAMTALSAASSVMTTGSQLMQALPLKELAQAGMQLAESGYFRNRGVRGLGLGTGRNRDKTALPPPPGVGTPSVTCRVEGMTCCVPRQAVQDWQNKPPYLNSYNTLECKSVYVPTHDEMCATSSYDGDTDAERCGLILSDTANLQIYRHILTVPSRSVNNAICECVRHLDSSEEEASIKGASRWEFSLVAVEEMKHKKNETEQTAQKLVRGANAAVALTQLLGRQSDVANNAAVKSFNQGSSALQVPSSGIIPSVTNDPRNTITNTANAFNAIGQAVNLVGNLGNVVQRRRKS
eukprot:Gregarina_sp_Poly_1__2998@NODE_1841_length_3238_cov_6_097130_g1195_i0_p1_GENE_NODE_1841_length_3238_cov_6_097130_g1195_i0NODE_1841_length_3238_cov_6_097130_g1195_i0_p1_ORF_typecomplete_len713_score99_44PAN_1/PF00024_26/0_0043PAN_1/PF00024_26/1_2e03PAN_4/PF14295_6/0_018PAN_4/PF14295_6/5_6e03_NODE_1841_length_3238_cov_6_097130_g1195_i05442682